MAAINSEIHRFFRRDIDNPIWKCYSFFNIGKRNEVEEYAAFSLSERCRTVQGIGRDCGKSPWSGCIQFSG